MGSFFDWVLEAVCDFLLSLLSGLVLVFSVVFDFLLLVGVVWLCMIVVFVGFASAAVSDCVFVIVFVFGFVLVFIPKYVGEPGLTYCFISDGDSPSYWVVLRVIWKHDPRSYFT